MRQSSMGTRHAGAASLLRSYVGATKHLAGASPLPLRDRAAGMLQDRLASGSRALAMDADTVISRIVEVAAARAADRPPPIYVVGLGGSGSHWLTGMLGEILPAIDLGEVPMPADLAAQIDALPVEEQGFAVDCLHLCYASASLADATSADLTAVRFLHSAVRVIEPRHREWDPGCSVVYLLRDPRDQAACFAFRKRAFRQRHYPAASDDRYLAGCAANNARNFAEMRDSPVRPDFVCRYEELKSSAPEALERLCAAIGHPVEPEAAVRAAREHDAGPMRTGALPRKGNLFAIESRGWREETDARQKLILHSYLAEVVTAAGYPADDCTGQPLTLHQGRGARRIRLDGPEGLGMLYTRDPNDDAGATWSRLGEAKGEVAVDAEVELKLRVHEQASASSIQSLRTLPADALDSLCMAGNVNLDDDLLGSCTRSLRDLREIDLARTATTDRCIPTLASLSNLVGINVLGANLTTAGVSALEEKLRLHPERRIPCDVVTA
jgi:hypothetical protein